MDRMTLKHPTAEQSMMPVGNHAGIGVLREVLAQPFLLRRSLPTSAQILRPAVRIERDDMPRAKLEAVISLAHVPRLFTPILKVSRCLRLTVLMIPQGRLRSILKLSPRRAITILKFRSAALVISQIPGGKHRPRYFLHGFARSASPVQVLAPRDVSRSYKGKGLPVR